MDYKKIRMVWKTGELYDVSTLLRWHFYVISPWWFDK